MNKKKAIINILLCIILTVLVVLVVVLYKKEVKRIAKEAAENVTLTEIGYGSEVQQLGYEDANGILTAFVNAYNEKNGEGIIQIMDLVSGYIFEQADYNIDKFDEKYVEILSNPSEYDDLVIMQYSLKNEEASLIQAINQVNVQLSVEENSEIEDLTKYLSKMTAKIKTVSEEEGINQVDNLEFLLLHKGNAYHILNYYAIDENGNKLGTTEE